MLLDEQVTKYSALDAWFKTAQGNCVAQAFFNELQQINGHLKGERLLQLGTCGENLWFSLFKFHYKWLVNPSVVPRVTTSVSSLTSLPFERDSMDCIIAPLSLEAFPQGKNPIDEIDRVLKPMGYVIFFGINPCSFWGAALALQRLNCFGHAPGTLTSSLSLKRTMLQRGYKQCALSSFYYIPPIESPFWMKKLEFFNEMGKMIWPFPAGFYCFIAQKYQYSPPPLRVDVRTNGFIISTKSPLQAITKWIHDD